MLIPYKVIAENQVKQWATDDEFEEWAIDNNDYSILIVGITDGFDVANLALQNNGLQKLFCKPSSLSLGKASYINMLKKYSSMMGKNGLDNRLLTSLLLLRALKETFPCNPN